MGDADVRGDFAVVTAFPTGFRDKNTILGGQSAHQRKEHEKSCKMTVRTSNFTVPLSRYRPMNFSRQERSSPKCPRAPGVLARIDAPEIPTHRFSQKVSKNPPQKTVPMKRASQELHNAVSNAEIRLFFTENEPFQVRLVVRQQGAGPASNGRAS